MDKRPSSLEVLDFIIENVGTHPKDIARFSAETFGISRQAASRYLRVLTFEGLLVSTGRTKGREYRLKTLASESFELPVTPTLREDVVWREKIQPLMEGLRRNVIDICQYGFTEMLNNVVDHSGSASCALRVSRNPLSVNLVVSDSGVGIFNKLQNDFGLDDPRHALLELSKGKLTSDSSKHTGEGIFFTSRMFDEFAIMSGKLFFCRYKKASDWLIEVEERQYIQGTTIIMNIRLKAEQTIEQVFNQYASEHAEYGFTKTHVPVELAKYGEEKLVSRSQAKRVLTRFERFKEVLLDFTGVTTIGQAFADEIFRVYRKEHPGIMILWVNASPEIEQTIKRARFEELGMGEPVKPST